MYVRRELGAQQEKKMKAEHKLGPKAKKQNKSVRLALGRGWAVLGASVLNWREKSPSTTLPFVLVEG